MALNKVVKAGDVVLQLGANIGTSCISSALANPGAENVCVEPSSSVIPSLKKNIADNKVTANTRVVEGVVGESDACAGLTMSSGDKGHNNWDSTAVPKYLGPALLELAASDTPVKCNPLKDVMGNKNVTVLFADCEGCLGSFLRTYSDKHLSNVRALVLEMDADDGGAITAFAKKQGMVCSYYDRKKFVVDGIRLLNRPVYSCAQMAACPADRPSSEKPWCGLSTLNVFNPTWG